MLFYLDRKSQEICVKAVNRGLNRMYSEVLRFVSKGNIKNDYINKHLTIPSPLWHWVSYLKY